MAHASMKMSAGAESSSPSETGELERALAELGDRADEFAQLSPLARAALLRECIPRLVEAAPAWVAEGAHAKRLSPDEVGEEWLSGPMPTVRMARLLAESLEEIERSGRPPLGTGSSTRHGRLSVDLFPPSPIDRVLFAGFSGYALMEEGVDREVAVRRQAGFYRRRDRQGSVSLVLGAGNVSSIPPMDVFTKMFEEGSVCILKINPVNEWVGRHLERALTPLISRGYLRIAYGGADVGRFLVEHETVADVHITGSDRTHDLIVWGPPGPERERRLAANEPRLEKPISSELGNVSAVAIVPYTYDGDDLWFQARNVATMVANNASFNCNAAKLLVTARGWPQRQEFLDMVRRALGRIRPRRAYYPGALDRYRALVGERESAIRIGDAKEDSLPWTLLLGLDADAEDEPLFSTEPFCGILSETSVGSADPVEFLERATDFMNDRLWGTLNTCLVIPPQLESDSTVGAALGRAILRLRYGTVTLNHWPALVYASGTMPWGGHPSANLREVRSGIGWVHNTFMLEGVEKSVLRGPLRVRPDPVWLYDNVKSSILGPKLVELEAQPSWLKIPGVILSALWPR